MLHSVSLLTTPTHSHSPQLLQVRDDHFQRYLEPPWLLGAATDPVYGAWFVYHLFTAVGHEQAQASYSDLDDEQRILMEKAQEHQAALQELWVREGLGNTEEKMRDWKKIRNVAKTRSKRREWSFTKAELPAIFDWFASRLLGGMHSNLPLEQNFSSFGNVTGGGAGHSDCLLMGGGAETNQGAELKEHIMMYKARLRELQYERCDESMRSRPAPQHLVDDGITGLRKANQSKKQLEMVGQQVSKIFQQYAHLEQGESHHCQLACCCLL